MSEISFNYRIPCTSDFNSLTRILGITGFYDVFPGTSSTITVLSGHPLLVNSVACTPVPSAVDVTFTGCVPVRFYQAQMASAAAVGETKNLVTFELATDGVKHLYFCVDLKRIPDSYYPRYSQNVYLKYTEPGTPPNVIETIENIYTNYNFASLSGANDRYQFGFSLVKLPGRGNDPKKFGLMYTFDYSYGPSQTEDITLTRSGSGDIRSYAVSGAYASQALYLGCMIDLDRISLVYPGLAPTIDIFSPEAGPESAQAGMNEPAFDDRSDTVGIPTAPTQNITGLGFFNVYRMELSSLNDLHNYLFGSAISSESTTEDILKAIGNNMFHAKLTDYIVSCHLIPVDPTPNAVGVTTVNLGNITATDVTGVKCTTDYIDVDCGSINLPEYYENFADFLESCRLFLPFIGFVPAQPEWFKNTTLSVSYRFNIIDGSCVAFVTSSGKYTNNGNSGGTIVAQYSGTACIRYPITGLSYASMATGVIGATAGMLAAGGAGSLLGVAGSAVNMAQAKPTVAQSNGYNSCSAMMGVRRPYLYIERPVSSYARNYQHELGIPANIYTASLGSVSGFVKMENVHVDGIAGATDFEKNEIARLLAQGVIV